MEEFAFAKRIAMISEVDRSDADHVQGKEDPVEQYVGVHDVINQFIPLFWAIVASSDMLLGYLPSVLCFNASSLCFSLP